jgi:acyl dehydratase
VVTEIRFDDLDGFKAAISDEFGAYGEAVEITQAMVDQFAELTGDHQWIHVDVDRARAESPFRGTIAHGFLILSLLGRFGAVRDVTIVGHRAALNYGSDRLRYLSPVVVGSRVRARSRLGGATPKGNGTLVTTEWELGAVGADKPAVLYHMQILYLP